MAIALVVDSKRKVTGRCLQDEHSVPEILGGLQHAAEVLQQAD